MSQSVTNEALNESLETGSDIANRIDTIVASIAREFRSIPSDEFFRSPVDAWSPALNLKHLNKAALPLSLGLALPKVSFLPMGKSDKQRSYKEVRDLYLEIIKKGAGAGVFTPLKTGEDGSEEKKLDLIKKFEKMHSTLTGRIRAWEQTDLLRYRMPHPILGLLSVREMLFFATYHLGHHAGKVLKRRA